MSAVLQGAGEFVTPAENITVLDEIRPGFHPSLPRIPYSLMEQAIGLFRHDDAQGKGAATGGGPGAFLLG